MAKMYKATPLAKILGFLLIASLILGGAWFANSKGVELPFAKSEKTPAVGKVNVGSSGSSVTTSGSTIELSLDEWIGWKSVIDANGGLTTQPGSIFDKLGIKVNIKIINDATESSTALIKGSLNSAGYTINRYAFLYPKFKNNKVPVKMAYITNYSSGGDGIIAKSDINSIEDLVGRKIAVPRFSEAQTLIEWLLAKSSLTDDQVKQIRKDMVYFATPDEAAKAFFAGKVDAAATWQPYLAQAQETAGAKLLFSTKIATNMILDGIVFRQDFLDNNREVVQKFIEGTLMAADMYTTEFDSIKKSMPLFQNESNENIVEMAADATLADFNENKKLLNGTAQTLFSDMSNIWLALGEDADPSASIDAFDSMTIQPLAGKFTEVKNKTIEFTAQQREAAKAQSNDDALMRQRLTVNFETNSASIKPESFESLNKFAETAKLLNGVIIQIEGNTDNAGNPQANKKLSEQRASSVVEYLKFQGIDASRFIVVGNGQDKPIADNGTAEGKAINRRTEAFFKTVQ